MCDSITNGGVRVTSGGVNVNICQPCQPPIPPMIYISNGNALNTFYGLSASNLYSCNSYTTDLYISGNVYGANLITANITTTLNAVSITANTAEFINLHFQNSILDTNLPILDAAQGTWGSAANVAQVTIDQYGRVAAVTNVLINSSQWTAIDGNIAYQNGVSIGTLSSPPVGANLYVLGTANIDAMDVSTTLNVAGTSNLYYIEGDGGGIVNVPSSSLVGNVARANVAMVVSQPAQPNITSLGILTGLHVEGLLIASNGSGISNLNSANLVGNVSRANVALVVSQPAQPNVTSLGTLTGLHVQGLLIASNGSGISNVNASNLVGNVAQSNIALVVSQPDQPNITSLGTLTGLNVQGLLVASDGSGISNINSSNLVGNVANANVAMVVSQPAQPNVTSLGTLTGLNVQGLLVASDGSGISNINSSNLVGNVARANVALVVSQPFQPNILQVGTLTGLYSSGNVTATFFLGGGNALSNVQSSNLVGNVANANVAMVVSQPAQPNITSVGALTSLTVIGSLGAGTISGDGQGLYGIHASAITETVATANSVVQAAQPNITSVGTLTGLNVQGLLIASNGSGLANLNASNIASGTLSASRLPNSGVSSGLYGSGANVSQVTVDQYGRVTAASNIAITASQWTGAVGAPIYYQNFVGIGSSDTPTTTLMVTGNVYASNSVTTQNLFFTNSIKATNLPTSGVTAGAYGAASNIPSVTVDQYGRVTSAANIAFIPTSQWTSVDANVAFGNGVSIGTIANPPVGSNLYVLGTAIISNVIANGASISSLNSANLVGNVAQANIALVVSQAAQPNITSLGTLTGLNVQGLLIASNGSGISNLNSSNLVGNVARANVALVVSQASQPNITSVGAAGSTLTVPGLLIASNASGASNLNSANLVGNVARANIALVVSQASQPNITSVGVLTSLNVSGATNTASFSVPSIFSANATGVQVLFDTLTIPNVSVTTSLNVTGIVVASNGSGISNLNSANLVGNVAQANIALVVSQASQPNITSVGTAGSTLTVPGLLIASNASAASNLNSSNLVGNVASANVALVVSQPAQPNVTSLGTLTGLNVQGLLVVSDGSGIAGLNSANIVGNVARANVALVVSQPAQPNVTSLGTLTGLNVQGLLVASDGSGIAGLNSANLVGNVAQANVALVVSQPAQPNVTSLGTLTGLNVQGFLVASNGSGISNLNSANLVGNVAQANVALVVSQPAQPNITSVGILSSLTVNSDVFAGPVRVGRGANVVATDTVLGANVLLNDTGAYDTALGYQAMQNAGPFVGYDTAVGANTLQSDTGPGYNVAIGAAAMLNSSPSQGQDIGIGFSALQNDTGAGYNTALGTYSMQNSSPGAGNDTAVGYYALYNDNGPGYNTAVGGEAMQGANPGGGYDTAVGWQALQNDSGAYNTAIGANAGQGITGGQYNTALGARSGAFSGSLENTTSIGANAHAEASNVAVFPYGVNVGINTNAPGASLEIQGNIYVSNSITTTNINPATNGNTYVTGNLIVAGNVFSSLGVPLGEGGGYYFSLPSDIALQTPYTGGLYGTTYPLSVGLSNGWTITGTSTLITVTPNGNFKFSKAGAYKLSGVFQGSTDNITGLAVGSNVADVHGTDQGYMYRYTTFLTQNPTELIEIPFNVTDASKYYYLDLWCVDGGALKATATGTGGTYLTITPLQGGGLASGGPGGTPGTQWINSGSNIYFSNSVGIGAINPQYNLDVSTGTTASKFMLVSNISSLGGPTLNITSNVQISANLGVGGAIPYVSPPYALYVQGQGYFSGHVSYDNFSGYRNRLINGTFRIAARANTLTVSNTSVFSLSNAFVMDRWHVDVGNLSTSNVAMTIRQDVAVGQTNGFSNVANVYVTRAFGSTLDNTWICPLVQTVEASGVYDSRLGQSTAKPMVLSFYANAAVTGNYSVVLRSKADNTYFANLVTLTNSWNRYTVLVPACTIGAWGTGTSGSIEVCLCGVSFGTGRANVAPTTNWTASPGYAPVACTGAVNWMTSAPSRLQVTGVQLELGTITTPFEIRLLSETTRLCQRYFETNPDTQYAAALGSGRVNSIPFVVTKRNNANVAVYRDLSNLTANTNISQFVAYYGDGTLKGTQAINSYLSSEYGFSFNFTNTGSKFMDGSIMEAQFVWQADSEIY